VEFEAPSRQIRHFRSSKLRLGDEPFAILLNDRSGLLGHMAGRQTL
jgi:hypothetical protein